MLDAAKWDILRDLRLSPAGCVEGAEPGSHSAARPGAGREFHDYRPYVAGDDITQVDWKVFGRSDRYYLRRHRRESDLTVHLLVDASASMDFSGFDAHGRPIRADDIPTKLRYGFELAMALAFVAVHQGDRAGLDVYGSARRLCVPAAGTEPHLYRLREALVSFLVSAGGGREASAANDHRAENAGGDGRARAFADLLEALAMLGRRERFPRRSLVAVIGDFLDEPREFFEGADMLRHSGAKVVALHVLTPTELDLDHVTGPLRLVDPETRRVADAFVPGMASRYRQQIRRHIEHLRSACRDRGIGHHLLTTDEAVPVAVRRVLSFAART